MSQNKLATTKNQHYVPQFYQRFFSADKDHKTIGAYIIEQRKYIPRAPIKNQSSGDYFYSTNQKIEDALGKIEKLAFAVIQQIHENPEKKLSKEAKYTLYVFTIIQIGRTLDRVNFIQESFNELIKSIFKAHIDIEKKHNRIEDAELLTDEIIDSIVVNLQEPALHSLGIHAKNISTCIDLKMKILINKTSTSFITSDNPACMYNMFFERIGEPSYALGSKGLIIYMPVAKNLAIIYYDPKCYKMGFRKKEYLEITQKEDIENLNLLISCSANKVLYCLDKSISLVELEKYANKHNNMKPRKRTKIINGVKQKNSEIVGGYTNSMYCKLRLNFVKELPASKAIKKNYESFKDTLRPIAYER